MVSLTPLSTLSKVSGRIGRDGRRGERKGDRKRREKVHNRKGKRGKRKIHHASMSLVWKYEHVQDSRSFIDTHRAVYSPISISLGVGHNSRWYCDVQETSFTSVMCYF